MSSPVVLGRGPEKTTESDIDFLQKHQLHINLSDLRHMKPGVVAADVNYDLTVFRFSFSQQLQFGSMALAPAADCGRWCR